MGYIMTMSGALEISDIPGATGAMLKLLNEHAADCVTVDTPAEIAGLFATYLVFDGDDGGDVEFDDGVLNFSAWGKIRYSDEMIDALTPYVHKGFIGFGGEDGCRWGNYMYNGKLTTVEPTWPAAPWEEE